MKKVTWRGGITGRVVEEIITDKGAERLRRARDIEIIGIEDADETIEIRAVVLEGE